MCNTVHQWKHWNITVDLSNVARISAWYYTWVEHNGETVALTSLCHSLILPVNIWALHKGPNITYWSLNDVLLMMYPGTFSLMKINVLWFPFNWSILLRVQLTISQHWFKSVLRAVGLLSHETVLTNSITPYCISRWHWVLAKPIINNHTG